MNELEKIDLIRERLGLSYKDAKDALDAHDGDVIKAIINIEEKNKHFENEWKDKSEKVIARIKDLVKEGNVTKVKIKKDGQEVLEIPATVGALGVMSALLYTPLAIVAGIGTVAAMFNRYTLEIERNNGDHSEEDI
jgi:DNA-binding transcriptional MerR regulator